MKDYIDSHSGMEGMYEDLDTDWYTVIGCLLFSLLGFSFFFILLYIFMEAIFDLVLVFYD